VEVSARAPLDWPYGLSADGGGWTDLLTEIRRQRQYDGAARDVYYYGMVSPQASLGGYCRFGCVLGLAPVLDFISTADQIGLGIGYAEPETYSTAVHELGHAHGRGHAPCAQGGGIEGVDRSYPYAGGDTGTWGWDARDSTLIPPSAKDVMGYCEPAWISDYTYDALAQRSLAVNSLARVTAKSALSERWESLVLYADGKSRWAGMSADEAPGGQRELARVLDAQGNELTRIEVARVPLAHSADSFLYLPEPEPSWAVLELAERSLVLADVQPPL
jgi:hypothetical protein